MANTLSELFVYNLNVLHRETDAQLGSQPKVAEKGKVGQRTVGRALKGEVSTRLSTIEKLAKSYSVFAWQLLHPTLGRMPENSGNDPLLFQLIDIYNKLSPSARDKVVTDANWLLGKENPVPSTSNPYPHAPAPTQMVHESRPAEYSKKG
jgi:transcriptional regulator with XRE-family HTH domain